MIGISSLSMVSAGWFDFLDGGASDSIENPIVIPNNTKEIVMNNSDIADKLTISHNKHTEYNGAHYFDDGDKSGVIYSSKSEKDDLKFRMDLSSDVQGISDKNVRSAFVNFTKKTTNYDFKNFNSDNKESFPEFFTNPSSENGGLYLKFYDKDNNPIFTQNIVLTCDNDDYGVFIEYMKYWEYLDGWTDEYKHEFETVIEMYINVDGREDMVDTLKKTDRCEFHILLTNGTNADICIPFGEIEKEI